MPLVSESDEPAVNSAPRSNIGVGMSVAIDTAVALAAYFAAYRVRFNGGAPETFWARAWVAAAWLVSGQLTALALWKVYTVRPIVDWLMRVVVAVAMGTAASVVFIHQFVGFAGVSRITFLMDAVLVCIGAAGWRCWSALRARTHPTPSLVRREDDLVDISDELTTVRAVVIGMYRYRELVKGLVLKDVKLKYRGSVLGFLWSLMNPMLMVVVYSFAFRYILGIKIEGFVFYVMLGQIAWTLFATSAMMSTGSILDNAGLLKSVRFPRAILPIGTVLFNLVQYLLTASVLIPTLMLWYRVPLTRAAAAFPIFLILQVVFAIGVSLALATATVFFRDIRHLVEVALAVMFWTTPVVYQLTRIPDDGMRAAILLSPMSPFVVAYQQVLFFGTWPGATVWLVAATYAMGAFLIGTLLILAFEDRFTEHL